MTQAPREEVRRHPDPEAVASAVAAELAEHLAARQRDGGVVSLVLTGGSISRKVHRALADAAEVDWSRVELWWGDERFVPAADPERNSGQADEDLLGRVSVEPTRVHRVAPSDAGVADVHAAAAAYAQELEQAKAGLDQGEPWFDVLMLGIGPDGHCASLFPERNQLNERGLTIAVTDSPKPPPERVSMTMTTLGRAREVWFVATGEEKAGAVARSWAGHDVTHTPAAGPRGQQATRWYVDEAAAAELP